MYTIQNFGWKQTMWETNFITEGSNHEIL